MRRTAFVVLHYGNFDMTRKCIDSFGELKGDVYLVLNGEVSANDECATSKTPVGKIVKLPKNAGFAGGMNAGIRAALEDGYERVMILNNDVVLGEGFSEALDKILSGIGDDRTCFSPLILDGDGKRIWFAGARLSLLSGRASHLGMGTDKFPEGPVESDYLTGCAFCFPVKGAEEAGLLDESFFLYWEDTDWSLRFRKKGYKLLVFPSLKIRHLGSASTKLESGDYLYYYTRNQLKFLARHSPFYLLPLSAASLLLNMARMFSSWALFHGREGREKIMAVLSGLWGFALSREGQRRHA